MSKVCHNIVFGTCEIGEILAEKPFRCDGITVRLFNNPKNKFAPTIMISSKFGMNLEVNESLYYKDKYDIVLDRTTFLKPEPIGTLSLSIDTPCKITSDNTRTIIQINEDVETVCTIIIGAYIYRDDSISSEPELY